MSSTVAKRYSFTATQDWFSFNAPSWRALFPLIDSGEPRALEIGSWEGRSAVFLLDELCAQGGSIVCIDHFDLFKTDAGRERHAKVLSNLSLTGKAFRVMESFSVPALMTLLGEEMTSAAPGFDWVYIDGSHESDDTFLDAELAWRLSRRSAIFIFDDYRWNKEPEDSIHHPKRGIDAFMLLHRGEYEVLSSQDQYQMILRKTSEMRIGFLVQAADVNSAIADDAFGYHIHVAIAVDSSYALAAAVAIRSALRCTTERMTIYLVDCGLSVEDRRRLQDTTADFPDGNMVFLNLRSDSTLSPLGSTWAKISMLETLPVERVLYLDADILVKHDLRDLWNTDLQGKALGAVTDVGHPQGHPDILAGPYFNAGVLLFDLAKTRARYSELLDCALKHETSRYHDQDALNVHFRDNWMSIPMRWNAQGLGTYAEDPSPERDALDIAAMRTAAIVHFTGPVNPTLEQILSPHVQPFTSKPWGYMGAPAHPHAEEWWSMLDETPWRGWRGSDLYAEYRRKMKENTIRYAVEAFQARTAV